MNNLWSFIGIYAAFVLNLCGEKMTNMRSDFCQDFDTLAFLVSLQSNCGGPEAGFAMSIFLRLH